MIVHKTRKNDPITVKQAYINYYGNRDDEMILSVCNAVEAINNKR